jgi:hypothetical protein
MTTFRFVRTGARWLACTGALTFIPWPPGAPARPPSGGTLSAQAPVPPSIPPVPPGTSPQPGAPPTVPVAPRPPKPANAPDRLMTAQQLAFAAYPELRTQGLQIRVDESASGSTVTFGFATTDRDTILAVSRPREAQLVIEASFDAQNALSRALLRGTLAHTKERRQLKALTTGLADALDAGGAAFGPAKSAALLQQLDLTSLTPVLGALAVQSATFQQDASDDGIYWRVAATGAAGESLTLGFEPYQGRLVRFARGGGL